MKRSAILLALVFLPNLGCAQREFRGKVTPSEDGQTYLLVEAKQPAEGSQVYINGEPWPYNFNQPGPIEPGLHNINCNSPNPFIEFTIEPGTTFHFDYWGP